MIPYFFVENLHTSRLITSPSIAETNINFAIQTALSNGLQPIIKPHIDVLTGEPRYLIEPDNFRSWLFSYRDILYLYLDISRKNSLKYFVLGTELDKIIANPAFMELVVEIKQDYPEIKLIYSPSWDNFIHCDLFKEIDYIGVNAYFKLSDKTKPSISELMDGGKPYLDKIVKTSRKYSKKVIITEAGFINKIGTSLNPDIWNFEGKQSEQIQANCYESLLIHLQNYPEIIGVYWWNWELNGIGGSGNIDYTPRGKLAEDILEKYWR